MLLLSNIAKLYDGTSAGPEALHVGVDLLVADGTIETVGPHKADRRVGSEHQVIDCSSLTVTPGLIDCHGHITLHGIRGADLDRMNAQAGLLYTEKILYTTLVNGGVTTLRDVGGATHLMKRLVDEGVMIGPRLKIALCMLSTTGGHADFRGADRCADELSRLWPPVPGRPSNLVDGPWECRKRVREIAACGADLIKLCTSPGVASPTDKLEHRDFTGEEIEAICDEAAARGLSVAAHAHSRSGIELAVTYGVHDIQHMSYLDEPLMEAALKRGCVVTPTSWVSHALCEASGLSPFVMGKVRQVAEVHTRSVQLATTGGLSILAGTDPVLPGMHGRNYMELVYLIKDGVSPLTAWYGATGLAASEIGQEDTGRLLPGRRADFLLAKGDVVEQPELLDRGALVEVIKDGIGYRGAFATLPHRSFRDTVRESLNPSTP